MGFDKLAHGSHPLLWCNRTMTQSIDAWGIIRKLSWQDALFIAAILLLAHLVTTIIRWLVLKLSKKSPPRLRLYVLASLPLLRLAIGIGTAALIIPILVEPTFRNVMLLIASAGVGLAFAFKDYGSSLIAGLVTIFENDYQPGDWIEVDGTYGEVKSIGVRAVRIVTPDDTEVTIPHLRLWSSSIFNATSGNHSLLCVTDFYLHPDHDAGILRKRLAEIAEESSYRKPESPVVVIVLEKPWGTHYRLKAYVKESREQFLFMTDLTVRGKEIIRSLGLRFAQAPYAESK